MKKVKVLFSVFTLILTFTFLLSPPAYTQQESITITTYYPAPHGIFSVLRLVPRDTEPENPGEGDIYYDNTTDSLRYWNGWEWVTIGAPVISGVGNAIMMWSGPADQLPNGWVLCDGGTYTDSNGNSVTTPDLREMFIVGAGGNNADTSIGPNGYNTGDHGNADQISVAHMPSHNHELDGSGAKAKSSGSAHTHLYFLPKATDVTGEWEGEKEVGRAYPGNKTAETSTAGGGGAHSHSLEGRTKNTGNGSYYMSRPPYYALCFIMKL